jgi:hypothetical protein
MEWGVAVAAGSPSDGDPALTGTVCEGVTPVDTSIVLVVKATLGGMDYYFAQDPITITWRTPCLDNEVTLTPGPAANNGWVDLFTLMMTPENHPLNFGGVEHFDLLAGIEVTRTMGNCPVYCNLFRVYDDQADATDSVPSTS